MLIFTASLQYSVTTVAETVQEKKLNFFEHVYPLIEIENKSILQSRNKLIVIKDKLHNNKPLLNSEKELIQTLKKKYNIKKNNPELKAVVDRLLIKMDVIPPSLALAQSANESAWGKSRFAVKAKNYFGQWCYTKGCGLVPKQRTAKSKHEVRKFKSVQLSVRSYIKNINSTRAYVKLRTLRHKMRTEKRKPDGHTLAEGLMKYSIRGKEYVKEIRSMIKFNKLKKYDERFWASVESIN